MPFRAVIFDLDGTLLNTLEDIADAGNATLAHFGFPTHPAESYKTFIGDGVANLVRRAMPQDALDRFEEVLERMRLEYAAHLDRKTRPYAGIPELLDALQARKVALNVFSNKPDPFCQANVEQFFGRWKWATVLGESDAVPRKPDPAGAEAIANMLGIAPDEFVFVGDSPMDMKCGLDAGMTPVGVAWGFRERAALKAAGAKAIIDRPEELLKLA
ncbi:MAG: HAD family hydrolase [Thermodesulfobacteriota bacterium]